MIIAWLLQGIGTFFFIYLIYVSLYNFILAIAGIKHRNILNESSNNNYNRILILIPCYKDASVILGSAIEALNQNYPKNKYDVVVIADTLPKSTLDALKNLPIKLLEVSFQQSTKVRALNHALHCIREDYDALVILDADNHLELNFLKKFNAQFNAGTRIMQGQRIAKNSNTDIAILDGLSEKINNHIFRQGACNLDLSSSIAGSGFGGDYTLLKSTLNKMDSIGGFDKELEFLLLESGVKTMYFHDLMVLDEKVEKPKVFENQRKRWISSQYHYLGKYFKKSVKRLLSGDFVYFNSTILRNLQLPRLINVGLLPFLILYSYFFRLPFVSFQFLILFYILFLVSIFIAIPKEFYSYRGLKAALKLPTLFFVMFKLLFRLRGANQKFIHTPKGLEN